jgi:hypothetical protein
VARLRDARLIATVTPYARRLVRFATRIHHTPGGIDRVMDAVRGLA